jgi:hypothetical protein
VEAPTIDTKRLEGLRLSKGAHPTPEAGVCLLEAVAWVRGQPFSDHPPCVSPVLGAYGRSLNDALPEDKRQQLVRFIPRLVGTAGDTDRDMRRSYMALDYLLRHYLPAWLELAGLTERAEQIRQAPEVRTAADCDSIRALVEQARSEAAAAGAAAWDAAGAAAWAAAWDAAGAAAWAAAWDAAWDAAGDAAGAAAWAAAWDAAGAAAWAAAWDAAWAAAGAAAGDAAWAAAKAKLQPTVDQLQDDAIALFDRLIECA